MRISDAIPFSSTLMMPASGRKTLFLGPLLSALWPRSPRSGHGRRLLKAGVILQLHMQLQRWSFESNALDSMSLKSSTLDSTSFIKMTACWVNQIERCHP
ncbi:hypothetical protein C1H46_020925 [Malus baccata]|uniref:Uncharacterized protein n=1 Tax=Malus baccata TaxID=106549 RepID=A0A540M3Y4_MALBA|nr:hypothetical protein C1H46_020925 [Malus baccata]